MTSLRYATITGMGLLLIALAPLRGDDEASVSSQSIARIDPKLNSIFVSIDFSNAKIDQAFSSLSSLSRELDPDHRGIQFVVQPQAVESGKPITLKLDQVPLKVALHYVCELGRLHYKVNEHSISITPFAFDAELVTRTFNVDPSFVQAASNAGIIPAPKNP